MPRPTPRAQRILHIASWGGSPDPASVHVRDDSVDSTPLVGLYLPYVSRVTEGAPYNARHVMLLHPHESRTLGLALVELAGYTSKGQLWTPADA